MARGRPRGGKLRSVAAPSPPRIATAKLTYATASRVVDIIHKPLVILNDKWQVVFPNLAFCRAISVSRDEIIGRHLTTIGDRCLDIAGLRDFLDLIQVNDTAVEDCEIEVEIPALGSRVWLVSGERIRQRTDGAARNTGGDRRRHRAQACGKSTDCCQMALGPGQSREIAHSFCCQP